jgi:hypothetical protein
MADYNEVVNRNGILTNLNDYGVDTSVYHISLLPTITKDEFYVVTSDGKIREGAVRDTNLRTKDKVVVRLGITTESKVPVAFQFIMEFSDGSQIDARGEYARKYLKIMSKRK